MRTSPDTATHATLLRTRLAAIVGPDETEPPCARPSRGIADDEDEWPPEELADELMDRPRPALAAAGTGPRATTDPDTDDLRVGAWPSWNRRSLTVLAALLVVLGILTVVVYARSRPVAVDEASGASVVAGLETSTDSPSPLAAPTAAMDAPTGGTSPAGAGAADPATTASPPPATNIEVHVLGRVASPGVVTLPSGSRVHEAISAAGGLDEGADTGDLNLAQPLQDGAQLRIGSRSAPGGQLSPPTPLPAATALAGAPATEDSGQAAGPGANGAGGRPAPVNLNSADTAALETLPGVGPATAAKIITWREQNGGFQAVEQLDDVPGIGPKTYAELAPLVTV